MERITPVDPQTAQGKAKQLLDAVKAKLGIVPNMTRSMAVSPSVLEAYLSFSIPRNRMLCKPNISNNRVLCMWLCPACIALFAVQKLRK